MKSPVLLKHHQTQEMSRPSNTLILMQTGQLCLKVKMSLVSRFELRPDGGSITCLWGNDSTSGSGYHVQPTYVAFSM